MSNKEKYVEAKLWDPDKDPVYTAKSGSGGMGVMMAVTAVVVVVVIVSIVLFGPFGNERDPAADPYDPNVTTTEAQPGGYPTWTMPETQPPGQGLPGFTPTPPGNGAASPGMEQGIALYLGGQYQAAIAQFNNVLQADITSVNAFIYRGRSFAGLNNFHAAVSDFTHAHRLAPANAEILALRGGSYFRLGFHPEAIADLSRAIELDQNNLTAREYRARTYEAMGEHSLAQADFHVAAALRGGGAQQPGDAQLTPDIAGGEH